MKQAQDFVEFSGIDGFGNPGQPSWFQNYPDLAEGKVHLVYRYMMERLEQHDDVERTVGCRDRLSRSLAKYDIPEIRYPQVPGMLDGIHFQCQDRCNFPTAR